MLDAKGARKLVYEYNLVEKVLIPKVLQEVEKAARKGETSVEVYIGSQEAHLVIEVSEDTKRIIDRLDSLGFQSGVNYYGSSYIPRGLADDYDRSGPIYKNYGILISWEEVE